MSYTYPSAPQQVPADILRPSAQFRSEVIKVVMALAMFMGVYILLLASTVALAIVFGWLGFTIVVYVHNLWAILLGLGIIGVGLMVVFFTIKFLFARSKTDRSGMMEVSDQEYPELFDFIRKVSAETGTSFPRHIYLSGDVNASVSFNSGFWSMFFPVRKNLVIGLGLVNMTNLSEFKSVIAHEFGHFSQKSMRAGSYVYQANKVIYNMLYENDSYVNTLRSWASIHSIFAACANVTVKIVNAIQWVLRKAYAVVNKRYMYLSRQMEFNADAMSAKVAGSNVAVHLLRRVEFADACYSNVISKNNAMIKENLRSSNFYSQQLIFSDLLSGIYELPLVDGLPDMSDADRHYASRRRVNVDDQWASHPTRRQREDALNALGVVGIMVNESAWALFPDPAAIQQQMTDWLYRSVKFEGKEAAVLSDAAFRSRCSDELSANNYPAFYSGYYNARYITPFSSFPAGPSDINDITEFLSANSDINRSFAALREDIKCLELIADKQSGIKSFDFDGEKYRRSSADDIRQTLAAELQTREEKLRRDDEQVYLYFFNKAGDINPANAERLKSSYESFFALKRISDDNLKFCEHVAELVRPIYETKTAEAARKIDQELREATDLLKRRITRAGEELAVINSQESITVPEKNRQMPDKSWYYFSGNQFNTDAIDQLIEQINVFANWSLDICFNKQKELVTQALSLAGLETAAHVPATA